METGTGKDGGFGFGFGGGSGEEESVIKNVVGNEPSSLLTKKNKQESEAGAAPPPSAQLLLLNNENDSQVPSALKQLNQKYNVPNLSYQIATATAGVSSMYEEVENQRQEDSATGTGGGQLLNDGVPPQPQEKIDEEEEVKKAVIDDPPVLSVRPQRLKAKEIPQIERRNWLIHYHYVRKEMNVCKALIAEQLDETQKHCEFALYTQGLILRQEGKIEESLESFQQCAILCPTNQNYVKQIARSFFLLGKQKSAIGVFDEAEKLDTSDWEVQHWKGVCYFHMHDFAQAKGCLRKAVKLHRNEQSLSLLGKIFVEEGDIVSAIESYRSAIEGSPENSDLLTTLGLLYLSNGSMQQAFESLGRALSFNPSHSGAILAAGSMMQQHGDYDVALTKYRVAAQETPDSAQLWGNIGMCFYAKGKSVAAISCLKRASYLAPFDWKILYNLGVVHIGMAQFASAFHFLSAAININPKVPILYMTLAITLTHLEDYKNAEQAYEHATSLDKRDPTIALNYAIFLLKKGEGKLAMEWFSTYEQRLSSVRDPKTGVLRLESEVLDMAEKFRSMMETNGSKIPTSHNNSTTAAAVNAKEAEANNNQGKSASAKEAEAQRNQTATSRITASGINIEEKPPPT